MAAKFTIKCNSRDYFRYLLELLRVFNPFKKLDNRTLEVFAEMLYYYNECPSDDDEEKMKYISQNVTNICKRLNISKSSFYNKINILRKAGLINYKNPAKQYRFKLEPLVVFEFIFNNDTVRS